MRIILWDHYNSVMGGAERIIINLTVELSKQVPVLVVAFKSGVIVQELQRVGANYQLVEPNDPSLPTKVQKDDLLLDFGTFREHCALATVNPRFLLWRIFPGLQCASRLASFLCRLTFLRLDALDSLFFMDNECHSTASKELRHAFTKRILPVPIPIGERHYIAKPLSERINITYIGRGGRIWKITPLKKLAQDLSQVAGQLFHLHVFTDTNELFARELQPFLSSALQVSYHYGYTGEKLSQKLLELGDLHYSMGTACLEGAALGIPTILADASYEDFPEEYRYRWLFEDPENYAGNFVKADQLKPGHNAVELLQMSASPEQLEQLSLDTYAVALRYSCTRIANEILSLKPRARLRDGLRFMPTYWRKRLF